MRVDTAATVQTPTVQPRFILSSERPLFAWHHVPSPHLRRRAGIVLCPAMGYEYMSAYRTWRVLAERLAALGFDTLRLDYDGTGNSAGEPEESGRFDAWLRSIACAMAEVRGLCGSDAVALVGLRAGALLALQAAAAAGGVDRLVLWSPFASGRAYVRELKAFARLSRKDHADDDEDGSDVNAAGHIVTAETTQALAKWTLDDITTRPAADVLLVAADDRPLDRALDVRFEALGARVTRIRPRGTAGILTAPEVAQVPEHALDEIANWFHGWRAPSVARSIRRGSSERAGAAIMLHDGYQERPVRFGPNNRLFGLLTQPAAEISALPAIVLFNTSVEHHVGPQRLYVPLARAWAARGHAVLRFDLGGIGDSPPPDGAEENDAYPTHMLDDAAEAITLVRKVAGRRQVIVAGLCSGGWLAFRAAREGLDVDAIVSINPPLYLRDGAARHWLKEKHELERYARSLRDPSKWAKALRGDAAYAVFTRTTARALARRVAVLGSGVLGDLVPDGLAKDLCAIADRHIRSLFIFSRGDNGLAYFDLHAQPALRRAWVREFVQHVVVEGAGHSFHPRAAQRTLRELLIDFVASQQDPRT